jgi:hypothetical protein
MGAARAERTMEAAASCLARGGGGGGAGQQREPTCKRSSGGFQAFSEGKERYNQKDQQNFSGQRIPSDVELQTWIFGSGLPRLKI